MVVCSSLNRNLWLTEGFIVYFGGNRVKQKADGEAAEHNLISFSVNRHKQQLLCGEEK